jgi:phosphate uptake regulator
MGARDIGKRCDLILDSLLRQKEGVPANEAVAYGLMCRYAKRIAAHLGNIASGSVAALENLDFGDEAHRGGDKKT